MMELRDAFACAAMNGILSSDAGMRVWGTNVAALVEHAYTIADEMLREKQRHFVEQRNAQQPKKI